jgi:hypothetical protein
MKKLENFINGNMNVFNNLDNSEVEIYSLDEFDNDIIEYLKLNYRFDYEGICVYLVNDGRPDDGIWVENMMS